MEFIHIKVRNRVANHTGIYHNFFQVKTTAGNRINHPFLFYSNPYIITVKINKLRDQKKTTHVDKYHPLGEVFYMLRKSLKNTRVLPRFFRVKSLL